MAQKALETGEVARLAVVARREGMPEHMWIVQVLGDLGAGAQPREQVLDDVVGDAVGEAGV